MRAKLMAIVAVLGIALLGLMGCATRGNVQTETLAAQEQIEPEETVVKESEPCTSLEDALIRAEELANDKFYGATQYDGAIQFEFDSYALSAAAKETIDAVVGPLVEADKSFFIELQGHTDGFGTEAYNFQLGLARARAVMGYLYNQHGISLQRMNGFSCGELKPVADNSLQDGRAENRRVTLVVIE